MEIITNNVPRPLIYGYELSDKERQDFDYMDNINEEVFFRYKGYTYSLDQFSTVPANSKLRKQGWQGYLSDSYFSGVVIKVDNEAETVVVGTYFS